MTIKDIAKEAKVSIKTVSRVLNNLPYVKNDTRERVWKVVEKYGYFPSEEAKSLASLRKKTKVTIGNIGCILFPTYNKYSEPFFTQLLEEIENTLVEQNLHSYFTYSLRDFENKSLFMKMVNPNIVDGCILVGMGDRYKEKILEIKRRVKNLVIISDYEESYTISATYFDSLRMGYLATKYLLSLGHKRIACITGHFDWQGYSQLRLDGYKQALFDGGISYDPQIVREGEYNIEKAAEVMRFLLDMPVPPSAVFATSDMMAIGVYKAIQEKNLKIPGDISVIGADDIELASYLYPPLTSITGDKREMARVAVRLLTEEIAGTRQTPLKIVLPVEIVERQSADSRR
jgi:DNA-binding LacI/PurR family transcriptional regulator